LGVHRQILKLACPAVIDPAAYSLGVIVSDCKGLLQMMSLKRIGVSPWKRLHAKQKTTA